MTKEEADREYWRQMCIWIAHQLWKAGYRVAPVTNGDGDPA